MTAEQINGAVERAGLPVLSPHQAEQLRVYLDLLLKWNKKLNLTAIREPEEIVSRHFLESIQCARSLPRGTQTLLDYGSGAGFPGIPCAICLPQLDCTLAESQAKKASFLREVVRTLGLSVAVHDGRAELLPPSKRFDAVVLRAVDRMLLACREAAGRVCVGGALLVLTTVDGAAELERQIEGMQWSAPKALGSSRERVILTGLWAGSESTDFSDCSTWNNP